jgi:hypothetical protein
VQLPLLAKHSERSNKKVLQTNRLAAAIVAVQGALHKRGRRSAPTDPSAALGLVVGAHASVRAGSCEMLDVNFGERGFCSLRPVSWEWGKVSCLLAEQG